MPPAHVEVHRPDSLSEALEIRAAHPDALPIAGGTDLMVELNFDRARPAAVLDLTRVPELREWAPDDGRRARRRGRDLHADHRRAGRPRCPASRSRAGRSARRRSATAGRSAATSRTASPAGDALPPLSPPDAVVEVASTARRAQRPGRASFFTGPKRTVLGADELIVAVHVPAAAGPQQFAKVGTRNAMVIAVCSFALALWPAERRVASVHRLGRADAAAPPPTPRRSSPASSTGTGSRRAVGRRARALRRAGRRRPRGRSTTCAAPRPTAATRSACSRAGRCAWAWGRMRRRWS